MNSVDALIAEMARVRDEVIPVYESIGPGGAPALFLMRQELDVAARELAEGDAVAILRRLGSLQGIQL